MSKNITIKQNGVAKTFDQISKIRINEVDSGSFEWVPEQSGKVRKFTLNGEYTAIERDNVDGYRAVFINVPVHRLVGKDRSDDQTYEVSLDGSGNLVKRLLS